MKRPKLELVSLKKEYEDGNVIAVDKIDLAIHSGETLALLGASGCGKSTTLNMIVGLEQPTSGDIQIDGNSVVGIPPGKRNVGLVFQDYAVFTSMTVRQNLAFGLQVRGEPLSKINKAVDEVAELLAMEDRLNERARDLGGSELQRVAIGRTLVTKPEILLLDEPLSNLEAAARLAMRRELRRLQSEIGLTIIYVTHDQIEALSLADRIAVMNGGKILQVEETTRICEQPDHILVAGFLGSPPMNLLKGNLVAKDQEVFFTSDSFTLKIGHKAQGSDPLPRKRYTLGISPESINLASPGGEDMVARVRLVEPRGAEVVLSVERLSTNLNLLLPSTDAPMEGTRIGLKISPKNLVFFDNETSRNIDIASLGILPHG